MKAYWCKSLLNAIFSSLRIWSGTTFVWVVVEVGTGTGGADVDGANMDGANVDGANADGANVDGVNVDEADADADALGYLVCFKLWTSLCVPGFWKIPPNSSHWLPLYRAGLDGPTIVFLK